MIYDKVNYTSDISYLANTIIYEYDISKANINVLYSKGAIDKQTYDYLYNANRMIRQVYIGKLQRDDKNIVSILKQGIIEAKKMLFEANNIEDYEVLSIKNDAVFLINRRLNNTKFGLIEFKEKNQFTSFYKINNLEIYYVYNQFSKYENIEVKGISDDNIKYHNNYMIELLKDIFFTVQTSGVEIAMRMLKEFYLQYISYQLPVGYYRKFNSDSMFHIKSNSIYNTGFDIDNITEDNKNILDISYNISVLLELQKILSSMYFTKHNK